MTGRDDDDDDDEESTKKCCSSSDMMMMIIMQRLPGWSDKKCRTIVPFFDHVLITHQSITTVQQHDILTFDNN
jgi:hypothetical protein